MGILDPKRMTTQDHLDIADIRDDLVVLKAGQVSLVIETSALNFDLLDQGEQDAKIGSFASFLNSINFPIQIVIRTQRTDIASYLKLLEHFKLKNNSEAVVKQISLYQEFITNLTQSTQILDKHFYTIIPTIKLPILKTSWFRQVVGNADKISNIGRIVERAKDELYPKRDAIIKQYANLGITARQLVNDELIKLYYSVYEPDKLGLEVLNLKGDEIESGVVKGT